MTTTGFLVVVALSYCIFCKISCWFMKKFAFTFSDICMCLFKFLRFVLGSKIRTFSRNDNGIIILADFRLHYGRRRCLNFGLGQNWKNALDGTWYGDQLFPKVDGEENFMSVKYDMMEAGHYSRLLRSRCWDAKRARSLELVLLPLRRFIGSGTCPL